MGISARVTPAAKSLLKDSGALSEFSLADVPLRAAGAIAPTYYITYADQSTRLEQLSYVPGESSAWMLSVRGTDVADKDLCPVLVTNAVV